MEHSHLSQHQRHQPLSEGGILGRTCFWDNLSGREQVKMKFTSNMSVYTHTHTKTKKRLNWNIFEVNHYWSWVRDEGRRRKMQLNSGVVFRHYSEWLAEAAKPLAGKMAYLLASQIVSEVSWWGFRSLPAPSLCGIFGRLLQLGSFQLFPFFHFSV